MKARRNRLAAEKSPYLLQHADNPVDWYPWGQDAFTRARAEGKPIFLSIGYSTCHWCHVMERESFSDPQIAERINRDFVSIKVDREERPDVDKTYMTAVQAITGQGGWPLNVFLTPDLRPFFGGTYFPPAARWGSPGFPDLLRRVAELWSQRRTDVEADAARLTQALKEFAGRAERTQAKPPQAAWLDAAFEEYAAAFDAENGGFGSAPKFPMPVNQAFLLRYHARTGNPEAFSMAKRTLLAMAGGGTFDQLGGGFHRYSTDAVWRVPHFEKMLYDNAQLAMNYLEADLVEPDPALAAGARGALDYVLHDLAGWNGEIFSAEDADSEHREGAFYLWTKDELDEALGDAAALFCRRYGVEAFGNAVFDPHGELAGRNVLYQARGLEDCAERFKLSIEEAERRLSEAQWRLLERRSRRPRPLRDDKVLSGWNGLAISAFAKAAQVLGDGRYLEAASRAARFARQRLWDSATGRLWHRYRDGDRAVAGVADDYAFLAQGLLDLYEAGFEPEWLSWALELTDRLLERFEAPGGGFFLTEAGEAAELPVRLMDDSDNVEPCASSVAASNLLRLGRLVGRPELEQAASRTMARFGEAMSGRPLSLPAMLGAVALSLSPPQQIVIAGELSSEPARRLIAEARAGFAPWRSVAAFDERRRPELVKLLPWLADLPKAQEAAAYVCLGRACQRPIHDPAELRGALSRATQ